MKNTFYVSAPVDCYAGYGARSRDFVKALIELDKYEVKIIPQRWGTTPQGFISEHVKEWGFIKNHLTNPQLTEQPDIWCQISVPNEFQPIGKYNIGLTAGIESTACIPQWIEGCNRMNLILTSSNHSKKVFENTSYKIKKGPQEEILKLTTKVEVLMEGVNTNIYKPTTNKKELNIKFPEKSAFLFLGHWIKGDIGEDRKNVGLLVKAFYETFKNTPNKPALILKASGAGSSYMDREDILKKINIIRDSVPSEDLPNVYLLHGELSDEEINSLYNHPKIKAMVNLTKGEGFGRPLLEFSTVNKPLITTGWSGHTDFLKPEFTAMLGGKLDYIHPSACTDFLVKEAQWFNVDHSQVGYFLKEIHKNGKKWKEKAKRQGHFSRNNFSFKNMKEQLDKSLTNNLPILPKKLELKLPKLQKI